MRALPLANFTSTYEEDPSGYGFDNTTLEGFSRGPISEEEKYYVNPEPIINTGAIRFSVLLSGDLIDDTSLYNNEFGGVS